MLPFVYVTINFINVVSRIISSSCKRLIFIPRLLLHTNCHLFTEISSTHKFTPIHRNFIILKSFLNNHFVWMLSFVDTCLRFITNVIYCIDWHFFLELCICFQLSQLTNLLSTLWSTIVSLFWVLLLSRE